MALSPLGIATRGLLGNTLGVSADGYLGGGAPTPPPIEEPNRGGNNYYGPDIEDFETRIAREDEELLAVIIAATKVLH